jgi:prevent-host-death family protein
MTPRLSYTQVRSDLGDLLNQVQYQKVRLIVHRRDKDAAALVPVQDLELLEALEDRLEEDWALDAARKAIKAGGKPLPAEQVFGELGLDS